MAPRPSLLHSASRLRLRRLAMFAVLAAAGACSEGPSPTASSLIAGAYSATVFQVTPQGSTSPLDLLAAGSSLNIVIDGGHSTSGQMRIPKAFLGTSADFVESMAGSATLTGTTVRFNQTADTFVRDLTWTTSGRTISANQVVGGDQYNIVLTR